MLVFKKISLCLMVMFGLVVLNGVVEAKPNWKLPLEPGYSYQVTVEYGGLTYQDDIDQYHTDTKNAYYAIDFDNPAGYSNPKIVASASGTISKIGYDAEGYGNYVYIDHGEGYVSRYAHLESIDSNIKQGIFVSQGQTLGILGTSGNSTGTHLHFVVLYNGKCLQATAEAKPEPLSEYTDIKVKQVLYSDNYPNPLSFTFDSASPQGFTCGYDTQEAREPQWNEWRVRVVNNPPTTNPGVVSPEYASGMMVKGAVIKFSAKVIGNDTAVNAKLYIKHKDGNWNNVVPIGTIGTDHAYHTYTVDLSEATGSIPIDELEIAQFSLELSDGENGNDEYWYLAII